MDGKLTINRWADEDKPREKMMMHGVNALSNAELLAILIGSGSTDDSAVELMRKVLKSYEDDLNRLGKASVDELCKFKGIGPAKAVTIIAASELGRRRREEERKARIIIRSSKDVYTYFYPFMCDLFIEECWALLLNQGARVIDRTKISMGGLASTAVDIRCILREALVKRATTIILCHNHPSGNIKPSREDDNLTLQLANAAKTMNIKLVDHVILTDGSFYSYADEGKI